MRDAGMAACTDAIGNLRGRYPGLDPTRPALLFGSHLDSVRDADRFAGPLDELVALAAIERLSTERCHLPFPLEVLAFADEGDVRFQATWLGSHAMAGSFDPMLLMVTDSAGATLNDAIARFGGRVAALPARSLGPREAFADVEVHIE
jgi:allantoate deiminase